MPDEMPPDYAPTQVPEEGKPRDPIGSSDVDRRRLLGVLAGFGWSVGVALCFGLVGLIWLLPPVRRRARDRAGRCGTCRRHGTVGRIVLLGFLFLLCVGAGMRVYTAVTPQIICHSQIKSTGEIRPQPPHRRPTPRHRSGPRPGAPWLPLSVVWPCWPAEPQACTSAGIGP